MNRIPLVRIKGLIALWTVIFAVGGYEVHNSMVQADCARALAQTENRIDQYSKDEADVFSGWLFQLTHPPQNLKATWNEARSDWLENLGNKSYAQLKVLSDQRQHEIDLAAGHDRCV